MNKYQLVECGLKINEIEDLDELREKYRVWREKLLFFEKENALGTHLKMLTHEVDTPYGTEEEKIAEYHLCIQQAIAYLQEISICGKDEMDALESLVANFGLYLSNMFLTEPENQATIKKEVLKQIEIRNEYDIQHIMYAVVKALYPSARREVNQDTGCGTVRFDIVIEEIDTVIELKCTRNDHNDKKLFAELGQDGYFYRCVKLIIYIYDKHKKIKDVRNFIKALSRTKDTAGKDVKVYVEQINDLI